MAKEILIVSNRKKEVLLGIIDIVELCFHIFLLYRSVIRDKPQKIIYTAEKGQGMK